MHIPILVADNAKIHECSTCGWHRFVPTSVEERQRVIVHPNYGRISVEELARRDIKTHNCDQHRLSVARLRRV